MKTITVDARGLSCPEPVLRTKVALKEAAEEYIVMVDNAAAKGNVTRFLKKSGKTVEVEENDGYTTLKAR